MKNRFILISTLAIFTTISARSINCLDDFDLEDVQHYKYSIPNSDQEKNPHFWYHNQLNYYSFGKFDDSNTDEETTIRAGIYNEDTLIYKTEINCDKGRWENTILNRFSKYETILSGQIDKNLTSCRAGEPFDIIFKVNNFHAMSWIFNAQPLQYGVKEFAKPLQIPKMHQKDGRTILVTHRKGVKRPAVKVFSKYNAYQATVFVLKGTGRAKFDRFVFGQCDAWPKGMEKQCQNVRSWVHARSKANLTEKSMKDHLKDNPLDTNVTQGLGVFGNNRVVHNPKCITKKYFYWLQQPVHPDRNIPKEDRDLKSMRSYCCCTDMRTGQVIENNPGKFCRYMSVCETKQLTCWESYDPGTGKEVQEVIEKSWGWTTDEETGDNGAEEIEELKDSSSRLAVVLTVNNTDNSTGVLAHDPDKEQTIADGDSAVLLNL